jgi:hypothetical protein
MCLPILPKFGWNVRGPFRDSNRNGLSHTEVEMKIFVCNEVPEGYIWFLSAKQFNLIKERCREVSTLWQQEIQPPGEQTVQVPEL